MRRLAERPQNLSFFLRVPDLQEVAPEHDRMTQTAHPRRRRDGRDPALRPGPRRPPRRRPAGRREARPSARRELEERYGVAVVANVEAAAQGRHASRSWSSRRTWPTCSTRSPRTLRAGQLLVSLAAGITTAFIESRVPEGVAVVRVMPNTPALVDEGMAAISPGSHCDEEHLAEAEALMAVDRQGAAGPREASRTPSPRSPAPGRPTSSSSSSR